MDVLGCRSGAWGLGLTYLCHGCFGLLIGGLGFGLDSLEEVDDEHVDGEHEKAGLDADGHLTQVEVEASDLLLVLRAVRRDTVEHEVGQHGGHQERETTGQTLDAAKATVSRTREDAQPQVTLKKITSDMTRFLQN